MGDENEKLSEHEARKAKLAAALGAFPKMKQLWVESLATLQTVAQSDGLQTGTAASASTGQVPLATTPPDADRTVASVGTSPIVGTSPANAEKPTPVTTPTPSGPGLTGFPDSLGGWSIDPDLTEAFGMALQHYQTAKYFRELTADDGIAQISVALGSPNGIAEGVFLDWAPQGVINRMIYERQIKGSISINASLASAAGVPLDVVIVHEIAETYGLWLEGFPQGGSRKAHLNAVEVENEYRDFRRPWLPPRSSSGGY